MARFDRQPKSLTPAQRKRQRRDYLRRLQKEHGSAWTTQVRLPVYWYHGALVDAEGNILKGWLNSGAPRPPVLPRKCVFTQFDRAPLRLVPRPQEAATPSTRGTHLPWGSQPQPDYRNWSEP